MMRDPNCTKCPLYKTAHTVCVPGEGPEGADIILLGEAPGQVEDRDGRPFVGPAGEKLRLLVEQIGLSDRVRYENVVRCRPPSNRTPHLKEIRACRGFLESVLQEIRPRYVVALGKTAIQVCSGRRTVKVAEWRNVKNWKVGEATVIGTYHPAAALRDPSKWEIIIDDFYRIKSKELAAPEEVKWQRRAQVDHLPQVLAFDVETTGLDMFVPETSVLTVAWSSKRHRAQVTEDISGFCRALERGSEDRLLIGHNIKFDLKFMKMKHGLDYRGRVFDTLVAAHLLDENRPAKSLDYLASVYTGYGSYESETVRKAKKAGALDGIDRKELMEYNAYDVAATWRLYEIFKEELKRQNLTRLMEYQGEVTSAITAMELKGVYIDLTIAESLKRSMWRQLHKIDRQLHVDFPATDTINLGSPGQLAEYLYDDLRLECPWTTKEGKRSVEEDALLILANEARSPKMKTLLLTLIERRKLQKQLNTYVSPAENQVRGDGRLHAQFNQTGTRTGRFSSSGPNLQNIPKKGKAEAKKLYAAQRGNVLVECDYSQIELRVLAYVSRDPLLLEAYRQGLDLHAQTGSYLFGVPIQDVRPEERQVGKTINFGVVYGMGPKKLAGETNLTFTEARRYLKSWYSTYSLVRLWQEKQEAHLLDHGWVESIFGRRRHLKVNLETKEVEPQQYAHMIRQGCNAPIQSAASDLTIMAMTKFRPWLVANVHDSVLLEVPEQGLKSTLKKIRVTMENTTELVRSFGYDFKIDVPTPVEIKVGKNWYEMEEI